MRIAYVARTRATFRRDGAIATESSPAKPEQTFRRYVPATLSLACSFPRRCLPVSPSEKSRQDLVHEAIFTVRVSERVHFVLTVSVPLQMAEAAGGQMVARDPAGLMLMLR